MYTILVFGFGPRVPEISSAFSRRPAKFLAAGSASEFLSTAFSRVFDLWLINCSHPEAARLSVKENFSAGSVPFIFLVKTDDNQTDQMLQLNRRITVISDRTPLDDWADAFFLQIDERQAKHREKYLAGSIRLEPGVEALVSDSPLMHRLVDLIKDVAPTESTLLLHGETGTGKELLAAVLHNESRRQEGPFMAVNCGALPDTLLESELFGYEKGSFTGATGRRIGKIEHAAGGTLFLDEIETMSEAMQVRLLRVLQEKTLQRLGSNFEITTDFRLIAATNADPAKLLRSGRLRSDLYFRIAVFPIRIPPLRERSEDIPLLVEHFINKKKKDGRDYVQGIDSRAMKLLLAARWPGNIRELQNVIERAVMLADQKTIPAALIDIPALDRPDPDEPDKDKQALAFNPKIPLKTVKLEAARRAECGYLVGLLRHAGGRVGESARLAGMTPRSLYNKMRLHDLKKDDFKG